MGVKEATKKTLKLYSGLGWKSLFVKIRVWDAPYIEVEKFVPKKGKIVELGCGEGLFSNFLAIASPKRRLLGIEIDKDRVKIADRGLTNVSFKKGDVTRVEIPKADCMVMFHLLHHLTSFEEQEELIRKCKKSLKKNGKLVIVEIIEKPFIKYLITWFTDHFIVPWFFEKRLFEKKVHFRKKKDWERLLKEQGFSVRAVTSHQGKPFSHVVFQAQL